MRMFTERSNYDSTGEWLLAVVNNNFDYHIASKYRMWIKYPIQRLAWGYSDYDLGDMDSFLAKRVAKMLRRFNKIRHGHSMDMTPDAYDKMIEDAARYLDLIANDDALSGDLYGNSTVGGFTKEEKANFLALHAEMVSLRPQALKLFLKRYHSLWI